MLHNYCRGHFYNTTSKYCTDEAIIDTLWTELVQHYSEPGRYYHTLNHISGVVAVLESVHDQIESADACIFAAFYHDAVYDVTKKDNEEQSAEMAQTILRKLNVPAMIIDRCCQHIVATKKHQYADDPDTNLFTDADLAILGGTQPLYIEYSHNIRKEYRIYTDAEYTAGRTQALQHFLNMEHIYKTATFRERYEEQARKNIVAELSTLGR
ncbi:MAG: hypothetical protein KF744_00380 [Taibaiella sp.]|nr:hypothetical protein [Taibaiella sp.]